MKPGSLARASEVAGAFWSWRSFLATTAGYCSLSVLASLATGERGPQWLMRRYFESAVRRLGIVLVAEGVEKIEHVGPCVFCVNHNSMLDVPVVGTVLPLEYRWVAKHDVFKYPFVGWHLKVSGHISVDRRRRDNLERMEERVHEVIARGGSILFFPEGTRSTDGNLRPFKRGAFVTAVREDVPVLPIVIEGTQKLLTKGSVRLERGDKLVRLRALDPIAVPTEGDFDARVDALKQATREAMAGALADLRAAPG